MSDYEGKRKRGGEGRRKKLEKAFRVTERITDPLPNLVGGGRPVTDAAKSKLYEIGTEGEATILKAPMKQGVSSVKENVGRFKVRVELPGEEPYEAKVWQSFWDREWKLMQPETRVKCRVDPENRDRILLLVPETAETRAEAVPKKAVEGATLDLRGLFRKR